MGNNLKQMKLKRSNEFEKKQVKGFFSTKGGQAFLIVGVGAIVVTSIVLLSMPKGNNAIDNSASYTASASFNYMATETYQNEAADVLYYTIYKENVVVIQKDADGGYINYFTNQPFQLQNKYALYKLDELISGQEIAELENLEKQKFDIINGNGNSGKLEELKIREHDMVNDMREALNLRPLKYNPDLEYQESNGPQKTYSK